MREMTGEKKTRFAMVQKGILRASFEHGGHDADEAKDPERMSELTTMSDF